MSPLLAVALLAFAQLPPRPAVPFAEPPPFEIWASEDWPVDSLLALMRLPNASVGLRTRSNMLRPALAGALGERRVLVELSPGLVEAHFDQFRRLPRALLVVAVPEKPDEELRERLSRLGPQPLRFVVGRLDPARAGWLAGFKRAEVELDLRGRVPEQEELGLFLGLERARRVVRVRAGDPPAVIAGLETVGPVRLVIEAEGNRLPEPMLRALHRVRAEVRVRVGPEASAADLLRFAHLPRVSFELALGEDADGELRRVARLVRDSSLQARAIEPPAPAAPSGKR